MIALRKMFVCRKHFMSKVTYKSCSKFTSSTQTPGFIRCFCQDNNNNNNNNSKPSEHLHSDNSLSYSTKGKYEYFKEEDSPVILDIFEERFKALQVEDEPVDEFSGLNLKRGLEGVFDIEDFVQLLQREKAKNIFVVRIPPHLKYADYIVVVSGKSPRHMTALAEFIRRVFKRKRRTGDVIPRIEGEGSQDWIAIDLGNIVLHIFSEGARNIYDLESLWSLGPDFDEKSRQPDDPLVELLRKHSVYLGDLQPAATHQ